LSLQLDGELPWWERRRAFNPRHHPAGSSQGGEFAPREGGELAAAAKQAAASTDAVTDALGYRGLPMDEASKWKLRAMTTVGKQIAADESVSMEQLAAFNQSEFAYTTGTSKEATTPREMEAEIAANNVIKKWAGTSGDSDPAAIAVQLVAQETFGLNDAQTSHLGAIGGGVLGSGRALAELHGPVIKSALKGMYADTQALLKDAPDTVWLFRGVRYLDVKDGEIVQLQPMSSFSTSFAVAGGFGSVLAMPIPKDRIVSTARSGAGCLGEREVIVLGGHYRAHRVTDDIAKKSIADWIVDQLARPKPTLGKGLKVGKGQPA
jgi:hypothetical protein